ncbi:MAG: HAD family hydrolase [Phocaeicola sp.]|uniref:HAD family hydrolase n=1 Tax=Phocaeicola TaxID=909656 RepID=UPI00234EFE57|nr:HAD family hydrolase [Phocaeicola oris]MCE2617091.1 HAD family hydrolase [Phocaeicola oris]
MKKLIIFDLDGTLLNTIADLATATNQALASYGYPTHDIPQYKYFVGNGINKLFERALPEGKKNQEQVLKIRERFIPYYNEHLTDFTQPYPGIPDLLESIQQSNIRIAVASNKYQQATSKLIPHFFPNINFTAIFGQREGVPRKPDPTIVYDIMKIADVSKEEVLYCGDSNVDMQTAIHAGVDGVGVTWGFRPRTELEKEHPFAIVDTTDEILKYLA